MTLEELRESVPSNWRVYETIEGRFLFVEHNETDDTWVYTWTHPNASLEGSLYTLPQYGPDPFDDGYEALSYTWGSVHNPPTYLIEIIESVQPTGDSVTTATLPIHDNLVEALRHLRHPDKPRELWVDAICINQEDVNERNQQVKWMADIYSHANRVVIWLGPESADSNRAISVLSYIGEQVEYSTRYDVLANPDATETTWFQRKMVLPYTEETWEVIRSLISRSWFSRLWTVQEAQLANRHTIMRCGSRLIPWLLFRRAVRCLDEKVSLEAVLGPSLQQIQILTIDNKDISFAKLTHRYATKECSDPRDKIYGLLGLAQPAFRQKIQPQYSQSVGSVFKNAYLAYMDHFHRMEFLGYCSLTNRTIDAPTWVPDLTASRDTLYRFGSQFKYRLLRS